MCKKDMILFDGSCAFCCYSTQWIIKRDKKKQFVFVSLDEEKAKILLQTHQIDSQKKDSLVLISNGKIFQKSTAALKIAKKIGGIYILSSLFLIVPKIIRDSVYNSISIHRNRLMKKSCKLP